jgi:acetylornithine deacetylase/succinyl-diaminopimelate desuccinylase-like protein
MPSDHPLIQISKDILKRVSGVLPELAGAPSVADECDFAADMLSRQAAAKQGNESQESPWSFGNSDKGIINIPVNGGDAHNVREWVSKRSIMQVREAFRLLIEDEQGFLLMHKARREKAAGNT